MAAAEGEEDQAGVQGADVETGAIIQAMIIAAGAGIRIKIRALPQ